MLAISEQYLDMIPRTVENRRICMGKHLANQNRLHFALAETFLFLSNQKDVDTTKPINPSFVRYGHSFDVYPRNLEQANPTKLSPRSIAARYCR